MDDHLPTSLSILNKEWAELGRSAVPDGWHPEGPASPPGTLAELLAAVTEDPDGWLRALIARQQAGDQLAGRVVLQATGQHALGDHFDTRLRRYFRLVADAIADRFADRFTASGRHELRRRARRDAPRFKHEDAPALQPRRI